MSNLCLNLNDSAEKAISQMKDKLGVNRVELIRASLSLMATVLNEKDAGNKVVVVGRDGSEKELRIQKY